jgi:hypothetical protein
MVLIAKIVLVSTCVNSFAVIAFTELQARGRPDLIAKSLLVQLPIYLTFLIIFIDQFGLFGAVVVYAIRVFFDSIALAILISKANPLSVYITVVSLTGILCVALSSFTDANNVHATIASLVVAVFVSVPAFRHLKRIRSF